jgi:hypothetical protein
MNVVGPPLRAGRRPSSTNVVNADSMRERTTSVPMPSTTCPTARIRTVVTRTSAGPVSAADRTGGANGASPRRCSRPIRADVSPRRALPVLRRVHWDAPSGHQLVTLRVIPRPAYLAASIGISERSTFTGAGKGAGRGRLEAPRYCVDPLIAVWERARTAAPGPSATRSTHSPATTARASSPSRPSRASSKSPLGHSLTPVFLQVRSPGVLSVGASESHVTLRASNQPNSSAAKRSAEWRPVPGCSCW